MSGAGGGICCQSTDSKYLTAMLFTHGDVSTLKGKPWIMIGIRNELTVEPTMRRLVAEIPKFFGDHPVEVFVLAAKRGQGTMRLRTADYLFARCADLKMLFRFRGSVTGVTYIITTDESNRVTKAIKVDDDYVQGLIHDAEQEFNEQGEGVVVGSFVRVLNGELRDFCGTVESLDAARAKVRTELKTKQIFLDTPIRNLLNLSHVPPERRVFYYGDLVEQLEDAGLIAEDLKMSEPEPERPVLLRDQLTNPLSRRNYSRRETAVAVIRKLITVDKIVDPRQIACVLVSKWKAQEIKPIKNLFIVHNMLRENLVKLHYRAEGLFDWRAVTRKYPDYKFSVESLAAIDPGLGIPAFTPADKVAKDGRSREARGKTKVPVMRLCRQCGNALTREQILFDYVFCSRACAARWQARRRMVKHGN